MTPENSMDDERDLDNTAGDQEIQYETSLRPNSFEEYVGQSKIKKNLSIFMEAARMRQETLDHALFYGPPGLGKTTLASIISSEMGRSLNSNLELLRTARICCLERELMPRI